MNKFDRRKFLATSFWGFTGILTLFSTFKPFKLWAKFNQRTDNGSVFIPRDKKF